MPILSKDTSYFPSTLGDKKVSMICEGLLIDPELPVDERYRICDRYEGWGHVRDPQALSKKGDVVIFDHTRTPGSVENFNVGFGADINFVIKDWTGEAYGHQIAAYLSAFPSKQGKAFSVWRRRDAMPAQVHPAQPKPNKPRLLPMNPYHSKRIPL